MNEIVNRAFDEERAFYGSKEVIVRHCALMVRQTAKALLRSAQIFPQTTAFLIFAIPFGMFTN
ncbi:MAG: hypothetical protein ACLUFV_03235 [Acutalibacteraceae bacterium]